jgi:hypothetical protein
MAIKLFCTLLVGFAALSFSTPTHRVHVSLSNESGFFTIKNASDTDSWMNDHENEDLYVFVVPIHKLPSRTIYWDYESADYILSAGESMTLYANGNEEFIIRLGYSSNATDWKWQRTLTVNVRQIESFWD